MAEDPREGADSELDDLRDFIPRRKVPWGTIIFILVLAVAVGIVTVIYEHMPHKGLTVDSAGYIIVRPDGETWLMLHDGAAVKATTESARKFGAKTGPCKHVLASMRDPLLEADLEELDCQPGQSVLPAIVARMHNMGARFGYWADGLAPSGDDLETAVAQTPEVIAAIIDPRATDPQLVPLYVPLYPVTLDAARKHGLPPPVLISIRRNDLLLSRYRRAALADFLHRDRFIFAGAAAAGGWLVRELVVTPDGTPSLERLLVEPEEVPWPEKLKERTVRVARRDAVSDASAAAPSGPAAGETKGENAEGSP